MTTTTTSTSMKDDGNQPTSTTEGGGDGCQPVAMTILLYFSSFVLLTVYLLAHSHPTVHTMPSIMRATAPCVQSLPTPSAYAHCKHCFLSPFFRLLTIYFPMCYSLTCLQVYSGCSQCSCHVCMPSACQPYVSPTAPVRLHVADTSPTTSTCPYIGKQHVPSHARASACGANAPLVTLARLRAGQCVCLRGTREYFLFYLFRFINCKYPCASRRVLGYISMPARRQTCPQTRQRVRTQADTSLAISACVQASKHEPSYANVSLVRQHPYFSFVSFVSLTIYFPAHSHCPPCAII